jgi:hypothetical protein
MRFRQPVKDFRPVALLAAIIACLYCFELGIVPAVVGAWCGALGIDAANVANAVPALLLDDGVCFALAVLFVMVASSFPPLGNALTRTLAAIRAIKVNPHFAYPIALSLLAGAAWFMANRDTGIVRGMFLLLMDNGVVVLKRLVVATHAVLPPANLKEPTHTHPICRCVLNPFVQFPADAVALGVVFCKVAVQYNLTLESAWRRRKRATPSLPAIQEF